jgi:hypothetical protein
MVAPSATQIPSVPSAPSPAEAKSGYDQRGAPRIRRQSQAQLFLYPYGRHPHPIDVTVVDYSATGIGIVHEEGLLVGQRFIVHEPHVTRDNTCIFTVVRSDPRPDGAFSIGLHVGNKLCDEIDLFTSPPRASLSRNAKVLFFVFAFFGAAALIALKML